MPITPTLNLYYDFSNNNVLDSNGSSTAASVPYMYKANNYVLNIEIYNTYPTKMDLSSVSDWKYGISTLNAATSPLVETLNADIDSSNAATGTIVVQVNTNSTTLDTYMGTAAVKTLYEELRGDDVSTIVLTPIYVRGTVYE